MSKSQKKVDSRSSQFTHASTLSILIALSASIVTLTIHVGFTDPLNRPKLILLCLLSLVVIPIARKSELNWREKKLLLPVLLTFTLIFAFLFSAFVSEPNFQAAFVGSRGRNLGALTYILFLLTFCIVFLHSSKKAISNVITVFGVLAALEISYGLIQRSRNDFIDWNNPYSPIIQTFGNPNFASAFNGIGAFILIFIGWSWRRSWLALSSCWALAISGIYLILISSSSQGLFTFLAPVVVVIVKWAFTRNRLFGMVTILISAALGFLVLLATLNKGPISQLIYQGSISARGDYWRAAIRMFTSNLWFGVGLDNYGSYYGESRDLIQVSERGYATISDNAHNVYLQLAATGGILVLIPYISLLLFIAYCAIRLLVQSNWENHQNVILVVGIWVAFLLVAVISIDNIGFTIWQWIFSGLIVRCYLDMIGQNNDPQALKKDKVSTLLAFISCTALLLTFFFLLLPRARADLLLMSSMKVIYGTDSKELVSEKLEQIYNIAPKDESMVAQLASIASQKKYPEIALLYSRMGLNLNPRNLDLLKFEATAFDDLQKYEEASQTRRKIYKLDPFNLNNLALLSQNYALLKNEKSASEVLNEIREINPKSEFIVILEEIIKQMSSNK